METGLFPFEEVRSRAVGGGSLATLVDWFDTYPMNGHADLGRAGAVCPFTRQARRFDTVRLGLCAAGPGEEDLAFAAVRRAVRNLDRIPAAPGAKHLRTIVVGFPNCCSEAGVAMVKRIHKRHKYYTLVRFRMIGFLHAASQARGLWNTNFHPMRAPMPVLAIRFLVEQDAAFVANHHLLIPTYLLRFGFRGAQRLYDYWRQMAGSDAVAGT